MKTLTTKLISQNVQISKQRQMEIMIYPVVQPGIILMQTNSINSEHKSVN